MTAFLVEKNQLKKSNLTMAASLSQLTKTFPSQKVVGCFYAAVSSAPTPVYG